MLLEQGVEAEVLGDPPEGRHGAEVADRCGVRAVGVLEAPEEVIGLAEMGQDNGSGFAVDPSALHDLPVGMSADRLGHEARHEISVYGHRHELTHQPTSGFRARSYEAVERYVVAVRLARAYVHQR